MRKTGEISRTTHYRRLREARAMNCLVGELPDKRGKHTNHRRGYTHPRWRPGGKITSHGYVKVNVGKSHPLADPNGYAYEHQLVVASALGIGVLVGKVIHHKNGDITDNRIENLAIIKQSEHVGNHNKERSFSAARL